MHYRADDEVSRLVYMCESRQVSSKMSAVANWQPTWKLIKGDLFQDKKVICFS